MNEIFLKKSIVSVSGIIISGSGELKTQLFKSPFLSSLIFSSIICVIDTDYGGKFGFNQSIKKCANLMKRHEFENEDKLIENAMKLMANDDELKTVSIGFDETLSAIKSRIAKRVILCSENYQYAIKAIGQNDEIKIVKFAKNEIEKREKLKAMLFENESDSIETESFVGFFSKLCNENKIELKLVGNHSPITHEFAKGLSGCIAILHYAVNIDEFENDSN